MLTLTLSANGTIICDAIINDGTLTFMIDKSQLLQISDELYHLSQKRQATLISREISEEMIREVYDTGSYYWDVLTDYGYVAMPVGIAPIKIKQVADWK